MATTICPSYSTCLTIDLGAIRANYRAIAERIAPAECGAVVKADAYGLGAAKVASALLAEGCRTFFVAQLAEAVALQDAIGTGRTIFILNGLDPGCEAMCASRGFIPVLNSLSQIEHWRATARQHGIPLPAALQVDSGMSRLGIDPEIAGALAADRSFKREVSLRLLMTHLACADDLAHPANAAQLARFQTVRSHMPGVPASAANSGGSFLSPDFHFDVVRPGIALFGVPPRSDVSVLQPVVRLAARVLQIRDVPAGEGVGYGHDYITREPRRLATLGIGYADGWPRHLSDAGAAWHNGMRLPIAGRISMDSLTIDISALAADTISEGDFVELVGPSQSLEQVAGEAGTIAYEILTRLGRRHQRIYVDLDWRENSASGVNP